MKILINKKFLIWSIIAILAITAIVLGLVFGLRSTEPQIIGAVVSNGRGCAEIGTDTLESGGSAVDAAIATLLCESVILPHSMGMGGGFVATLYTKETGKIETLIARESAPAAAHKDMFVNETVITGPKAGAVPGELLGYWEMHQKYGKLPWKDLFEPTIELCNEGHWISPYLAAAIKSKEQEIRNDPGLREIFIKKDGTIYKEGEYMTRPQLGETYAKIAKNGISEMYGGGEVGRHFVEDLQEIGGIITEEDLMNYKVLWDDTNHIAANITGGYTLYTTPLPTSGVLLAFILNVMNELFTSNEPIYWQRVTETFKHAYGQRTNLGDFLNDPEMAPIINET